MNKAEPHNHQELDERSLRALEEIEGNPGISQRDLSSQLGVALGITNSLIKALTHKGLIKIRGSNNRSITYHLTKAGILHKSRLALEWTLNTIGDYRRMRRSVEDKLKQIAAGGADNVVLYGANELAEIAAIVAPETGMRILGVADSDTTREWVGGYRVTPLSALLESKPDVLINCYGLDVEGLSLPEDVQTAGIPVFSLLER